MHHDEVRSGDSESLPLGTGPDLQEVWVVEGRERPDRRSYEKPVLIRHGTLKDITLLSRRQLYVGDEQHSNPPEDS